MPRPGGIVAIVGDEVITEAELERVVGPRRAQLAELYPPTVIERELGDLRRFALDRMIDDKLILQLVRKEEEKLGRGPLIPDAALDRQIELQVESLRRKIPAIRDAEDLYRVVRERDGLSRDEYRKSLREQLMISAYIRQKVFQAFSRFVSPEEARIYYKAHIDEFTEPEEIAFRQILIKASREDAVARKKAVEEGLQAEIPFLDLAQAYSEEVYEGDADAAGRLWRKSYEELKSWREPIPRVLRSLGEGETSEAVRTVLGIQFFHVEEVVEGEPKSFAEAQKLIERKIRRDREQAELAAFIRRERANTSIQILLPEPASSGEAPPEPDSEEAEVEPEKVTRD